MDKQQLLTYAYQMYKEQEVIIKYSWAFNEAHENELILRGMDRIIKLIERQPDNSLLLEEVLNAWQLLPEGNYTPKQIQYWLVYNMHPVINKIRKYLTIN